MNYQIIYAEGDTIYAAALSLEHKVRNYIKLGWEPLGGISVSKDTYSHTLMYTLMQAMIIRQ